MHAKDFPNLKKKNLSLCFPSSCCPVSLSPFVTKLLKIEVYYSLAPILFSLKPNEITISLPLRGNSSAQGRE